MKYTYTNIRLIGGLAKNCHIIEYKCIQGVTKYKVYYMDDKVKKVNILL